MNKRQIFTITIVSIAALITLLLLFYQTEEKTLIFVGTEYPPHETTQDGKPVGITIDLANKICFNLDIECKIELMDWSDAISEIKTRKADVILDSFFTEERKKYLILETEENTNIPKHFIWHEPLLFFYKGENNFTINSYQDIIDQNLNVGLISDYGYGIDFWSYKFLAQSFQTPEELFNALEKNHIEVLIAAEKTGDSIIEEKNLSNIVSSNPVGSRYLVTFAFSKHFEDKKLRQEFLGEYSRLKEEGYHKELEKKYTS